MNLNLLKRAPKFAKKAIAWGIKHQAEIETAAGVVIGVTATVMACKATVKMGDILEEGKTAIDQIKEGWSTEENRQLLAEHNYTEADYKKELSIQYTKNVLSVVKLYVLPVSLLITSYALIIHGHLTLKKRNAALIAAYTALDESFKAYRQRVREKYGEEADLYFQHGIESQMITEEEVDPETGKTKKVKKKIYINGEEVSVYAKFFDESCRAWTKDPTANLCFLKAVQEQCNRRLQADGFLFLNDVYDDLGFNRTSAGAVTGWIVGLGDSYVDFGLYEIRNRDFINCEERTVLLDFNVDGVIVDKI